MKRLLCLLSLALPWSLRRWLLQVVFKYEIARDARIGFSWVMPERLIMGPRARIGHLTMCKGLELLEMGEQSAIGNGCWITAMPRAEERHFAHQRQSRCPRLRLGDHSAITHRHIIDCTNTVDLGCFVTFAGYGSQVLTHSIDLAGCRQSSEPVYIGDYCFVGTAVVILGGSVLPPFSVLGAKALLNKSFCEPYTLYAGIPARPVQEIDQSSKYFLRTEGFIV
jgi:acetyltransferase-like isoleucine patch superfamily enzyme